MKVKRQKFSVAIDPDVVKQVDDLCGERRRSLWIEQAVRLRLDLRRVYPPDMQAVRTKKKTVAGRGSNQMALPWED